MLSVLGLLGEGDRDEEEDMRWWEPRERGGGDEWQSRDEWRDRRDDRRGGDGEGRPASLLVMPAPGTDEREPGYSCTYGEAKENVMNHDDGDLGSEMTKGGEDV